MKAIKIDANGLYVEDVLIEESYEQDSNIITVHCPDGFYLPKWNGTTWEEGMTQNEIETLNNAPKLITDSDRIASVEEALNTIIMMMM